MGLTRRTDNAVVFLAAKHNCLWQEIKDKIEHCDQVEVTNPETRQVLTKYGYRFDSVEGRAVKVEKYDRKYGAKRYFGFKLHMQDGADKFILDMPYQSHMLRKLLRIAPNMEWHLPFSITVFKGKKEDGSEEMVIWVQQDGATVKHYFTKENPRGMPPAVQDAQGWDFRTQQSWLVKRFEAETIPEIDAAAVKIAPPTPMHVDQPEPEPDGVDAAPFAPTGVTEDDVPF